MKTVVKVASFTVLAWVGYVAHNVVDLPELHLESWEYVIPTAIYAVLFVLWWLVESRITRLLFVGWVWLQIIGGGVISVLPIPFLPFEPAQTTLHYAMHGVLIASHLPLALALRKGRI